MEIDTTQQDARDNYKLLVHSVVPRPIAWITSVSADGVRNLAPFSYFAAVTAAPPTLMVSIGKRGAMLKDTSANLLHSGECIVHIPHRHLVRQMVQSSAELEPDVDEIELAGLDVLPGLRVNVPRLSAAAIALECKVLQHLEIGQKLSDVFFVEVVYAHIADDILDGSLPDPAKLAAIGRLGGNGYCDTAVPFFIERPK